MTGAQRHRAELSMRILMIIDGLPGGGAEKVLLTLAQGLLTQGHQVSLFTLRDVCDYQLPSGVDYKVSIDNTRTPWRKMTELSRRAKALDTLINASQQQNGDFDLVVSHLHKTDRIVARCHSLQRDRVWFCLHSMFSPGYLGHRHGFSRWLKRQKIQRLYQQRNLIAVSQAVLQDMKHAFRVTPAQAQVIYNPFDIATIRQMALAPCDMAGREYVIHVGRLHAAKRQDRLLQAYALSGIQVPLLILGKGNPAELNRLQAIARSLNIAERVIFRAFDANPYPYIHHAKLLILSSDSEGFGNVLVEALLCHTPVVSTRCPGGPAEILTGELAVGLAELTVESLAEKMRQVYQHPPVIDTQRLAQYDIATVCSQYIALAQHD